AFSAASQAQSGLPVRTLCIFDPVGARGPVYNALLDYQTNAMNWGVQLNLKAYTNEAVVIADYSAGHCDAMGVTGTRVRPYNRFTPTMKPLAARTTSHQEQNLSARQPNPKPPGNRLRITKKLPPLLPAGPANG